MNLFICSYFPSELNSSTDGYRDHCHHYVLSTSQQHVDGALAGGAGGTVEEVEHEVAVRVDLQAHGS